MDNYEFDMKPGEIVMAYREARDKTVQIKILAECNLCTTRQIAEFLREHGEKLPANWNKRLEATPGQGNPAGRRPSAFWNRVGEKNPPRFRRLLASWGANEEAKIGIASWDGELWFDEGGYKVDAPDFWMRLPRPPLLREVRTDGE